VLWINDQGGKVKLVGAIEGSNELAHDSGSPKGCQEVFARGFAKGLMLLPFNALARVSTLKFAATRPSK
jgi:hypothetical protein